MVFGERLERFISSFIHQDIIMKAKETNLWKNRIHKINGIGSYQKYKKDNCERCGSKTNLIVHHKDCNRKNNKKNNLETLCSSCQAKEHKFYTHFKEAYKKEKRNKFGRFGEEKYLGTIKCIKCGKKDFKNNHTQKYCKSCNLKYNFGHYSREKINKLMKMKNDNKTRRLYAVSKYY